MTPREKSIKIIEKRVRDGEWIVDIKVGNTEYTMPWKELCVFALSVIKDLVISAGFDEVKE